MPDVQAEPRLGSNKDSNIRLIAFRDDPNPYKIEDVRNLHVCLSSLFDQALLFSLSLFPSFFDPKPSTLTNMNHRVIFSQ